MESYKDFLTRLGYRVFTVSSLERAAVMLGLIPFAVVLISSSLVDDPNSPVLRAMKKESSDCKFVLVTTSLEVDEFMCVLHGSVFHECIAAPSDLSLLGSLVQDLIHLETGIGGAV